MKEAFTISSDQFLSGDRLLLRTEILSRTGDEEEVDSILRSLDRLGSDGSIEHYELTPIQPRRAPRGSASVTWSVRAVRAD